MPHNYFDSSYGMPNFLELKEEETLEFSWGHKRCFGGPNNGVQFYDSFTYDGIEYSLYDCVYMWADDQPEPYIGKLVKIWETASHKKKVKVVWFFRPIEIAHWLGDIKPLKTEIFLATGEGKGLFNLNPLVSTFNASFCYLFDLYCHMMQCFVYNWNVILEGLPLFFKKTSVI